MKRRYRAAVLLGLLAAVSTTTCSFGAGQVKQEDTMTGPGVSMTEEEMPGVPVKDGQIIPENLEAAREADQMIVVVGTGGCNADVFYYQKNEQENWGLAWQEAGIVGRNGITADKAEGDGKTPSGTYSFTLAFGLLENPGAILPYHLIREGDRWVDDPASAYYNQLVNTAQTPADWNSAENLPACSPYYNYALALNYNEVCVPGKGSAIFLHCYTAIPDNGSAGCIRLPQERMEQLLRTVTENTRIVIAPNLESLK